MALLNDSNIKGLFKYQFDNLLSMIFLEGDLNHGLRGFRLELVVQGDPPEVVQSSERPFRQYISRGDIEFLGLRLG